MTLRPTDAFVSIEVCTVQLTLCFALPRYVQHCYAFGSPVYRIITRSSTASSFCTGQILCHTLPQHCRSCSRTWASQSFSLDHRYANSRYTCSKLKLLYVYTYICVEGYLISTCSKHHSRICILCRLSSSND